MEEALKAAGHSQTLPCRAAAGEGAGTEARLMVNHLPIPTQPPHRPETAECSPCTQPSPTEPRAGCCGRTQWLTYLSLWSARMPLSVTLPQEMIFSCCRLFCRVLVSLSLCRHSSWMYMHFSSLISVTCSRPSAKPKGGFASGFQHQPLLVVQFLIW